ncbi:hypothetical protein LZ023_37445 (plasmid) [Pseudomonas silvicola]|nr:hypothetical protein LZ023_37445 [Pseudomonas silvicola]
MEFTDQLIQVTRLLLQRLRSGRGLFHKGGVLLGNIIHLINRLLHLNDALALLHGSRSDLLTS